MTARKNLTKTLQKQLRQALETERAELLSQVADLESEADISRWRDGGFDDDPADTGSANVERDRAQSLSSHARSLLTAIDTALVRMDEGGYGTCERCGTPIERERLEALPYAALCMTCKQREERRR
jgi:DnaK suppressor protein